jgi:hypothetical protein
VALAFIGVVANPAAPLPPALAACPVVVVSQKEFTALDVVSTPRRPPTLTVPVTAPVA